MPVWEKTHWSHTAVAGMVAGTLAGLLWLFTGPDQWHILAPTWVMTGTITVFVGVLWDRHGHLPLLDIGVWFMIAAFCYAVLPFLQHVLCGMIYTIPGHGAAQFYAHPPTVGMMAALAWRYAVFVGCFAVVYLVVRGAGPRGAPRRPGMEPGCPVAVAVVLALGGLTIVFAVLRRYGVEMDPSYTLNLKALRARFHNLPLLAQQVAQNLYHIRLGLQLALAVVLVRYWSRRWARVVLLGWMTWLAITQIGGLRARTPLVVVLLAFGILWHTFVRPVRLRTLALVGLIGLVAFSAIPVLRGAGSLADGLHDIWRQWTTVDFRTRVARNTEFQNGLAGTYDLYRLKQTGLLVDVPWQVRAFDVLVLIPQQLLPFEKVDPQKWYHRELADTIGFFMVNPIGQAILGFDWIELILRGAGLGVFFGWLHRWYAHRPDGFWRVWVYLWLTIFAYYAIRATTFILLYWIMYRVVPALLGVWLLSRGIEFVMQRWRPVPVPISRRLFRGRRVADCDGGSARDSTTKADPCAASADR